MNQKNDTKFLASFDQILKIKEHGSLTECIKLI